jgi:hypothetical protein
VRADDGRVYDPEISLAQLLIEGQTGVSSAVIFSSYRPLVQVGHVKRARRGGRMRICGGLREALKDIGAGHAPMKIKKAAPGFNAKDQRICQEACSDQGNKQQSKASHIRPHPAKHV